MAIPQELLRNNARNITARWVQRLKVSSPFNLLKDISLRDLKGNVPMLLEAVATALEKGEPWGPNPRGGLIWSTLSDHVELRRGQGAQLGEVLNEFRILRSEVSLTLHKRVARDHLDPEEILAFEERVNLALDDILAIATQVYHEVDLKSLRDRTRRDALTKLFNHVSFFERLHDEIERSQRFGYPVSVVVIDLDGFKRYNDQFGHQAGDSILRAVAEVLVASSRSSDTVARYGGDEFSIILPGASKPGALIVAQRLRDRFKRDPALGQVGMSIGVAVYPEDAVEPKTLVEAADRAMYEAKEAGGDRITMK